MKYKIILVLTVALLLTLGVHINHHLPDPPYIAGRHDEGIYYDLVRICVDPQKGKEHYASNRLFIGATLHHEMIHSLKSMGIIDIDIPIASAFGYFFEWKKENTLTDNSKIAYFNEGKSAVNPNKYISDILKNYQSEFTEETLESYIDGARMAGAMYTLFKDAEEHVPLMYIIAIGFRLDHISSMYALEHRELFSFIFGFRRGHYFMFDEEQFNSDLRGLPEDLQRKVEYYISDIEKTHVIGLVRKKSGIIDIPGPDR